MTELMDAEVATANDFARRAEAYRPELLALCYRMLGSVHDAEDLVQETYLRAWRSRDGFQGRASLRTWLYRIATNACLTALANRSRRPLPSGLGAPSTDPEGPWPPVPPEVAWLEPMPDALLRVDDADPASVVAARTGLRLALVAALQLLPARQRAVLILRDVLAWRAAEVAELLEISAPAANSLLQRARERLADAGLRWEDIAEPDDASTRALLDRYAAAFEAGDVDGVLALLTADAVWEMPPQIVWFRGTAMIRRLLLDRVPWHYGGARLVPVRANGQPAFASYLLRDDGVLRFHAVHVLTLADSDSGLRVARVSMFRPEGILDWLGLPEVLERCSAEPAT